MLEKVRSNPLGNPAVVGLAGFGGTTLLLQFHNLGWCGVGSMMWAALFFGGLMQLVAGLQEFVTGANFGYAAFSTYGAFWMALCMIFVGIKYEIFTPTHADIGWFLVTFTLITIMYWIGSMRLNSALAFCFTFLVAGFILLDIAFLGPAASHIIFVRIAAVDLIICALLAWYVGFHIIFHDLWKRDVLPVGGPWIKI